MKGNGVVPADGTNDDGKRRALLKELQDVLLLKEVFESNRIRGAAFECEVCADKHYLDWDLLVDGLEQTLTTGEAPAHEPAVDPDPKDYVSWEYARGLLDGYESFNNQEPTEVSLHLVAASNETQPEPSQVTLDKRRGSSRS